MMNLRPVNQTVFGPNDGNCFSACLATILGVGIDDIPNFHHKHGDRMIHAAREWLANDYGLSLITINLHPVDIVDDTKYEHLFEEVVIGMAFGTIVIAAVKSTTNPEDCYHAVVGTIDKDGKNVVLLHDPNPDGRPLAPILSPKHIYFLVPLDYRNWMWGTFGLRGLQ